MPQFFRDAMKFSIGKVVSQTEQVTFIEWLRITIKVECKNCSAAS